MLDGMLKPAFEYASGDGKGYQSPVAKFNPSSHSKPVNNFINRVWLYPIV